jgi:hypothetical protein
MIIIGYRMWTMLQTMTVADAKAHLPELVAAVAMTHDPCGDHFL